MNEMTPEHPKGIRKNADEYKALQELKAFLRPRIEAAERGEFSDKTFEHIKAEARKKLLS